MADVFMVPIDEYNQLLNRAINAELDLKALRKSHSRLVDRYVEEIDARVKQRIKALGRQYGIASRTIHDLRIELAETRFRTIGVDGTLALEAKDAVIQRLTAKNESLRETCTWHYKRYLEQRELIAEIQKGLHG